MKTFKEYLTESSEYNVGPLYHGTSQKFDRFKQMPGKIVTIFGSTPVKRTGYFFTPSRKAAEEFGDIILTVYLSLHNPVDFTTSKGDEAINKLVEMGWNPRWFLTKETWELFDEQDGEDLVNALSNLGYDGAIIDEPHAGVGRGGTSYVVFNPSQIKIIDENI